MANEECPHTMKIGAHEARIIQLESKVRENEQSFENRLNEIALKAQHNAEHILQEKAKKSGFFHGVHVTATLLGYFILIVLLLVAGKVTGGIENFIKLIASLGLKL